MPTFNALLNQISWIPLEVPVLAMFVTGAILVLIRDWRVSVAALLVQYLAMGLALSWLVRPEIAFAKVLVGLFVCLMLYLSARQANWRQRLTIGSHGLRALLGARTVAGEVFPPGRAFRLMSVLLIAVTAVSLARTYPISALPPVISIGVYWLALIGVLLLILTENPLKTGQGLLTIIIGFELWYTTLEESLLVVGLWGVVTLLLALTIGYLAAARGAVLGEDF